MFLLDQSISVYKSSLLQTPHGFGTKKTGDGRDIDVIQTLLNNEDTDYSSIVIPSQTHSNNVSVITSPVSEVIYKPENIDAVVTNQQGIVLTVVTADCVPIVYFDPVGNIIGISHGGWKGTLEKIGQRVIDDMIKMGSKQKDIVAVIGPAIDSCCYDIYGERLRLFQSLFGDTVFKKQKSAVYLDLKKANVLTLLNAGLSRNNIDVSDLCTSCDDTEFFSNKRDQGIIGEMVSFIELQ
ncbi:peptidoglycan editing factor PgeF [Candidatus Roizmanbacteria bacterium]|nr:MAG: peptidoglycan editing factor PgeF [Candidatus Roizmanbacteria bacterium]